MAVVRKLDPRVHGFVANLRQDPLFRAFTKSVLLPGVPPWKPWAPGANIGEWAHSTGVREGYLLALTHFGVTLDDYGTDDQSSHG